MSFALAPDALAAGYRLEAHDTVGSTNALALQRAAEGDPGPLWIAALAQEAGRGRRGRAWASPHGNLAATLLVTLSQPRHHAATLGFVAGLSLAEALQAVAPRLEAAVAADGGDGEGARFTLKWPNDVLAGGAKLAGILLESAPRRDGALSVAVGIGVNVVGHPENLPYPATSLRALGSGCSAAALFQSLSSAWTVNAALWDEGRGLQAVRRKWLVHAAGIGGEAAVRLDAEVVRGTFETIDEDCRFVLRLSDGSLRRITAGDVHFGVVASASAA
jgi:BirA family transcriptional regulator, biotin operon repressor / biotin---[acetyl-CoA-carboxylase] ligase